MTGSKTISHPVRGKDYPQTIQEFDTWFASEDACAEFLSSLKWPDGFQCPTCAGTKHWITNRGLFQCALCQKQTSLVAGTVLEGTRTPLRTWLLAMWYVANQKSGVSALGLQRALGFGSYETAWTWLHKLRRAMVRPGRDRLRGCIEVDETYVGGPEEGVRGRETERKTIVIIAAEENGRRTGRIRMSCIPDVTSDSLLDFIQETIEPGAEIHTDGWSGYTGVSKAGFNHKVTKIKRSGKLAHELLPRVHGVASLLKRWLMGTHQGAASNKHLDYYLDEFTFRFNRRGSKTRGLLFYRLAQQAMTADPVPYLAITAANENLPNHKM